MKTKNRVCAFNPETGTVYCFAGGCDVDYLDVIDFIMKMDNSSKHEALVKAKALIAGESVAVVAPKVKVAKRIRQQQPPPLWRSGFKKYVTALNKHQEVKAFCLTRCLDIEALSIGYKSRKTADKSAQGKADRWGRGCLIFPCATHQES